MGLRSVSVFYVMNPLLSLLIVNKNWKKDMEKIIDPKRSVASALKVFFFLSFFFFSFFFQKQKLFTQIISWLGQAKVKETTSQSSESPNGLKPKTHECVLCRESFTLSADDKQKLKERYGENYRPPKKCARCQKKINWSILQSSRVFSLLCFKWTQFFFLSVRKCSRSWNQNHSDLSISFSFFNVHN